MGPIDLPAMVNLVTSAFRITKAGGRVQNVLINRRNADMELFCNLIEHIIADMIQN